MPLYNNITPYFTSIDLGHATDTTISRMASGVLAIEGARISTTKTRTQTVSSAATVTADADNDETVLITAQAVGLTLANPTGTPNEDQKMQYRIKDNGSAQTITFGAQFRAIGVTLPTTTVAGKYTRLGCIWNATDSKWDVVVVSQEA